jgi:translation initiation factor 2B subunit (eIF-2B alpha/beta/delta family)
MPERRFAFADDLRAAGLSAPDQNILRYLWQIVDEGVLGASKHVALGNELLLYILDNSEPTEALAKARLAANFIARTRGQDTPVIGNSLSLLLGGLDDVPAAQQPDLLRERIGNWGVAAAERKHRLVRGAVQHLAGAKGIMAFDYSSTVSAIVIALAAQKPELAVVVPESRTIAGGARYLEEFLPAGLTFRYIPDAAIEYGLGFCDTVLLGVETLRADGSFLNTVGSRMIARLARENGVEVFGCTDLLKLDRRSYDGHRPPPAIRSYEHPLLDGIVIAGSARADTRAPELEVIPSFLITALLTEYGPTPPQAVWTLGRDTFEKQSERAGEADS